MRSVLLLQLDGGAREGSRAWQAEEGVGSTFAFLENIASPQLLSS